MRYPFAQKNLDVFTLETHSKGISRLKVTFDDNFIFTAGDDGTLIIYENKEKDSKIKLDKEGIGMPPAEEFLIPREFYNDSKREIDKIKAKVHYNKFFSI